MPRVRVSNDKVCRIHIHTRRQGGALVKEHWGRHREGDLARLIIKMRAYSVPFIELSLIQRSNLHAIPRVLQSCPQRFQTECTAWECHPHAQLHIRAKTHCDQITHLLHMNGPMHHCDQALGATSATWSQTVT